MCRVKDQFDKMAFDKEKTNFQVSKRLDVKKRGTYK